jgi:hypothetical protein
MSEAEREAMKKIMERRKEEEQTRREHQMAWEAVIKKGGAVSGGTYTVPQADTPAMMKAREEWLEKTQHMRVVALNEACEIAKTHMGYGDAMSAQEITAMAHMFASFLIDGKS